MFDRRKSDIEVPYKCIYCSYHTNFTEVWIPDELWIEPYKRMSPDPLRRTCKKCGAFMYPRHLDKKWSEKGKYYSLYDTFSNCPNASECASAMTYKPSCEQMLMGTHCLRSLHAQIKTLQDMLMTFKKELLPPK